MKMTAVSTVRRVGLIIASLIFLAPLFAAPHSPTGKVSGVFKYNDRVLEPKHVYAFRSPGSSETSLVFTLEPLEIGMRFFISGDQIALMTEGKQGRLALKLSLNAEGSYVGHSLLGGEPLINMSGIVSPVEFRLDVNENNRIAGTWRVDEPIKAAGNIYDFGLTFDAEIADPARGASELPPGGGSAGRAFMKFLQNVQTGKNIEEMRLFTNLGVTLTPQRTPEEIKEDIEFFRTSMPARARITGGMMDEQAALLYIDAVSHEGENEKLRALVIRTAEGWEFGGYDW